MMHMGDDFSRSSWDVPTKLNLTCTKGLNRTCAYCVYNLEGCNYDEWKNDESMELIQQEKDAARKKQ